MPKSSVAGVLVAVVGRKFDQFVAADGSTVAPGVSYKAWICEAFDSAPVAYKVKPAMAQTLMAAGPGCELKCETWLWARGDRIEAELDSDSLTIIPAN